MFNCPECGGSLVFDIKSQQLKCLHCSSEIPVEEYHTANHADEDSDSFGAAYTGVPTVLPRSSHRMKHRPGSAATAGMKQFSKAG